jgi:hypothetical protein
VGHRTLSLVRSTAALGCPVCALHETCFVVDRRYFTSALPRALLGAAPLAALGMLLERRLWPQAAAALFYVALYSKLPHKVRALPSLYTCNCAATSHCPPPCACRAQEVRFLFPVLPLFNACAAAAVARLYNGRSVTGTRRTHSVIATRN